MADPLKLPLEVTSEIFGILDPTEILDMLRDLFVIRVVDTEDLNAAVPFTGFEPLRRDEDRWTPLLWREFRPPRPPVKEGVRRIGLPSNESKETSEPVLEGGLEPGRLPGPLDGGLLLLLLESPVLNPLADTGAEAFLEPCRRNEEEEGVVGGSTSSGVAAENELRPMAALLAVLSLTFIIGPALGKLCERD